MESGFASGAGVDQCSYLCWPFHARVILAATQCRFAGGVYYRPVIYQGTTVYVVVR